MQHSVLTLLDFSKAYDTNRTEKLLLCMLDTGFQWLLFVRFALFLRTVELVYNSTTLVVFFLRLLGQFQTSLFVLTKKHVKKKRQKNNSEAKITEQNKNKQTKNNKDNNFLRKKTFEREKIVYFAFWCFFYAQVLVFFVKKINCFEIALITSNTIPLKCVPLRPAVHFFIGQKLLLEKLCDLWDAMPRHWPLCFLVSPSYLQDTVPCQWSCSDLPQVLQIWERVFYSQVFFNLHSFLLVLRLP